MGTNVAVIVGVGGLPTWPELLSAFVQCLESNDPNSLEGALDALYKVSAAAESFGLWPISRDWSASHVMVLVPGCDVLIVVK